MKLFFSFRRQFVAVVAALTSLLVGTSPALAAPGGGGPATTSGAATGGSFGAGGHGGGTGVGQSGGGHSVGQHVGSSLGSTRSFSPGFANGAGFNGARPGSSTSSGRLVTPNFGGLSHSTFGNGRVGSTGFVPDRNVSPGVSRSFNDGSGVLRPIRPGDTNLQPVYRSALPTRSNAWTDARTLRSIPAARAARTDANGAYAVGQRRLSTGQRLYRGASDYSAFNGANNRPWRDERGSYRRNRRYNPYYYNNLYYPLFLGGFFPAYYGGFDGGIGYDSGFGSSFSANVANEDLTNGLVTSSNLATYNNPGRGATTDPAADDLRPPADQPAQVGPTSPTDTNARPSSEVGPDSLVEAVQSELATRGYFPGKVDAMYGDSTREAIRRFQADQKLSVTGRINEATLHALQLD